MPSSAPSVFICKVFWYAFLRSIEVNTSKSQGDYLEISEQVWKSLEYGELEGKGYGKKEEEEIFFS